MHGGLVPRNGAKKDAKPPPTKNLLCGVAYLAAWRESRFAGVRRGRKGPAAGFCRSGCRDLTPVGAHRSEAAALWATRPQVSRLPFQVLRFRPSRFPFSRAPAPARGASLRSGSGIRGGSRSPALPFSRSPGRTAKAQHRSAKCEVRRRVAQMVRAVLDRTVAGRRMHGGLVPRNGAKKDAKPPPTKNLLCGVAYLAAWRESRFAGVRRGRKGPAAGFCRSGCRDLTPGGAHRSEAAALWATRPRNPKLGTRNYYRA